MTREKAKGFSISYFGASLEHKVRGVGADLIYQPFVYLQAELISVK